ncbi:MAG: DUF5074 domain-containing protein [Bacteroidota bacterium]
MKQIIALIMIVAFVSSCKKDEVTDLPTSKGVYIVNEGLYNSGAGEVSFYDPETKQISNNLFTSANGYSLGDVAQSMCIRDSVGFIVVNNSAKVEVVRIPSLQKVLTINIPASSPRFVLPVNDSIAYVTELYANKVYVVNFRRGQLVKAIPVPQYTEHLVKIDEYVFAEGKKIYSNPSAKGALMRLRIADHSYVDKIEFDGDAGGLVLDKDNHLWIAIDETSAEKASLKCFDKNLNLVLTKTIGDFGFNPNSLSIDGNGEKLFFNSGKSLYSSEVNSTNDPSLLFTTTGTGIYSMNVDPVNSDIYVSDALDFVQRSRIYRYDKTGQLIHSFIGGVISGNFSFSYE